MVFNRSRDMFQVARNFAHFFAHESCGFCTPCRVGTALLRRAMDKIHDGRGTAYEMNEMRRLAHILGTMSHCGLGHTAANPVVQTMEKFPDSYEHKLKDLSFEPGFDLKGAGNRAPGDRAPRPGRAFGAQAVKATASFLLDGREIPFRDGETILEAALGAGIYIPHLCYHPDFPPHGSCKLCTVKMNGRNAAACSTRAAVGADVENETPELNNQRRALTQMLFVEGNHFCPACEKSGGCELQAVGYHVGMTTPHFEHFYPARDVDASHPDVLLDRNRCILCELCVRASRDVDHKSVFDLSGRGIRTRLVVNSPSGLLADSALALTDRALGVCPVGAILRKREGFARPIGRRRYDQAPVSTVSVTDFIRRGGRRG